MRIRISKTKHIQQLYKSCKKEFKQTKYKHNTRIYKKTKKNTPFDAEKKRNHIHTTLKKHTNIYFSGFVIQKVTAKNCKI